MKRILILAVAALPAFGAQAQYGPPGARPAPVKPASAAAPARAAATAPTRPASTRPTTLAPFCFEPMDLRNSALVSVLHANGLLCPSSIRRGDPVRLQATPSGELTAEEGPATAWHRIR